MKAIKYYIKTINNELLPALEDRLGLDLAMQPNYTRTTKVSYAGSLDGVRTILEFSSNHIELKDYDDNYLFCNVYYGSGGDSAGIINLDNIDECVDQIYAALYELGYRSPEDIEEEKRKEEEKKQAEEAKKQAEEEKKKQNLANRQEEPEENTEEEPEEIEDNESEESIKEYSTDFDKYLDVMSKENLVNGRMEISIAINDTSSNSEKYKMLNIDAYYISGMMCLVQTSGINPKVDKAVTWDKVKNYALKIAEKFDGVISVVGYDPDDNELTISKDDTSNDTDVDVTI